jgi:hypothetical protein
MTLMCSPCLERRWLYESFSDEDRRTTTPGVLLTMAQTPKEALTIMNGNALCADHAKAGRY